MLTSGEQDEPPVLDKAYWVMKERIVEFEQILLRTINFQVEGPDHYRLLLNYARSLRLGRAETRTAWALVNDILFCPRALATSSPAVACAAIRIAGQIHGTTRRLRWFSPAPKQKFHPSKDDPNGEQDLAGRHDGSLGPEGKTSVVDAVAKPEVLRGSEDSIGVSYEDTAHGSARDTESGRELHALMSTRGLGGDKGPWQSDPTRDEETIPWWSLFDASDEEVSTVCEELMDLYTYRFSQGADVGNVGIKHEGTPPTTTAVKMDNIIGIATNVSENGAETSAQKPVPSTQTTSGIDLDEPPDIATA